MLVIVVGCYIDIRCGKKLVVMRMLAVVVLSVQRSLRILLPTMNKVAFSHSCFQSLSRIDSTTCINHTSIRKFI